MEKIRNIIFDLGGVFITIDFNRTKWAFEKFGITDYATKFNQHHASELFVNLEIGKISEAEFYEGFRTLFEVTIDDDQIKEAWNAMLGDFDVKKMDWLTSIHPNYQIFLFSNTNIIHQRYFEKLFQQEFNGKKLQDFFDKIYYSHELGLRKPNLNSWEAILNEQNLDKKETLFVDDTIENVNAAEELGLQVYHLNNRKNVIDIPLD